MQPAELQPSSEMQTSTGESQRPVHSAPFVHLDAEQERLEAYAREQFEHIRQEKLTLAAERKALEQSLTARREELDRQARSLVARLQQCKDREARSAEPAGEGLTRENETLRQQLHEQQRQVELLQAERDAAWSQLQQLREQQLHHLEEIEEKHNATLVQRDYLEGLEKERTVLLDRLQELEYAEQHRQTAQRQLDDLRRQLSGSGQPDSAVDLGGRNALGDGLVETNLALGVFQQQLEDLQAQRDTHAEEVARLRERLRDMEPLLADREAFARKLEEMSREPEGWADYEAEFNALRRQMIEERRQLNEDFQAALQRQTLLQRELEERLAQLDAERVQLDQRMNQQARAQGEDQLALHESELRELEYELRLREAEVRELREIAERELTEQRAELTQERLKLARLREALRIERGKSNP
jgi:chromosome segregation ATPase